MQHMRYLYIFFLPYVVNHLCVNSLVNDFATDLVIFALSLVLASANLPPVHGCGEGKSRVDWIINIYTSDFRVRSFMLVLQLLFVIRFSI